LLLLDIGTDISTAIDFFSRGHFNWGLFTTIPIFAPFVFRILLVFYNLGKCFFEEGKYSVNIPKIKLQLQSFAANVFWSFPLFHPIK
jgi:hypothetical protein